MTAPEPTAVERTIAEVEAAHRGDWQSDGDYGQIAWYECRCEWVAPSEDDPSDWVAEHEMHRAQAVVAAIRNLPPEQMAQLIEGKVEQAIRYSNSRFYQRAVTPWREVTGPATPARDLTPGARHDL